MTRIAFVPILLAALLCRPVFADTPTEAGNGSIRVGIGDSIEAVQAAFNTSAPPAPYKATATSNASELRIASLGISVFFDSTGHVYVVRFEAPFGDRIAGIALGESRTELIRALGAPTRMLPIHSRGAEGQYTYQRPDMTVRFALDGHDQVRVIFLSAGTVRFEPTVAAPANPLPPQEYASSPARHTVDAPQSADTKPSILLPRKAVPVSPEQQGAEAAEFGMFFGGAASQYDLCVKKGFIPAGKETAESFANSVLAEMPKHQPDAAAHMANVYRGWDLVKAKLAEHESDFDQGRCAQVARQWEKYRSMIPSAASTAH